MHPKTKDTIKWMFFALLLCIFLPACSVTLVQPYDADLYANTEAFYKKASAVISKGIDASPKLPGAIRAISEDSKEKHSGHYNQFKKDYDALMIDCNSLILRSLSNSDEINSLGKKLQSKIEEAITSNVPVSCDSLQSSFPEVSLTTRNYIDLKCLIGRWASEHEGNIEPDPTYGKQILKKSNWEGRSRTLFASILAIQKAEASKKQK